MAEKQEIWRKIDDYPNYEVSSLGRVRNIETGLILSGTKNNYIQICLRKEGTRNILDVHRIVAKTFIQNPENKPCVNHIDGNKHNNRVDNLEWVTYSENTRHAFRTGLIQITNNHISNRIKQKVLCVETGQVFESLNQVAKYLGVNSGSIHQAIRKRWRCGGLHFELV